MTTVNKEGEQKLMFIEYLLRAEHVYTDSY